MTDRAAVQDYVESSKSILDSSPQMDEANTKAAVLRDFLELLGWEIPQNTELEYSVEAFGQTYKVDYALVLDGTPVAFLEAKGADTSLTDDHEEQLSSYMTNKNVTYGILTNGKQYRFFQRSVDAANVDVQRVGDVALEALPDRLAVLRAYETEAIESGESSKPGGSDSLGAWAGHANSQEGADGDGRDDEVAPPLARTDRVPRSVAVGLTAGPRPRRRRRRRA